MIVSPSRAVGSAGIVMSRTRRRSVSASAPEAAIPARRRGSDAPLPAHHRWYSRSRNAAGSTAGRRRALELRNWQPPAAKPGRARAALPSQAAPRSACRVSALSAARRRPTARGPRCGPRSRAPHRPPRGRRSGRWPACARHRARAACARGRPALRARARTRAAGRSDRAAPGPASSTTRRPSASRRVRRRRADAEALARLAEVRDLGRVDADQADVHRALRVQAHDDRVAVDHVRHAPGERRGCRGRRSATMAHRRPASSSDERAEQRSRSSRPETRLEARAAGVRRRSGYARAVPFAVNS